MSDTKRKRLTSSASCEHYTHPEVVEAARFTLQQIDIDPASCAEANQVVRATWLLTKEQNGLILPWNELGAPLGPRRAFINPPSTEPGDVRRWWGKAMSERRAGHIDALIFVVFRIDALQSMMLGAFKEGYPGPQSAYRCEPRRRLQYWAPGARRLLDGSMELSAMSSAMHGSCILLHTEDEEITVRFRQTFERFGPIYAPAVEAEAAAHAQGIAKILEAGC